MNDERVADLHLHTLYSDGTNSPAELMSRAADLGLHIIAITDHDTVQGFLEAEASPDPRLRVIPGVELTAYDGPTEIHIVGLFIDPGCRHLTDRLTEMQQVRRERIDEMTKRLRAMGAEVDSSQVMALAGRGVPGRPHLAQVLLDQGIAIDRREVFAKYIGDDCPAYAPKLRFTISEAIDLIHSAGGAAAYAHPGLTARDDLIPGMAEAGLDAIEIYCPTHRPEQVRRYLEATWKYHLAVSGGSDCHGMLKDRLLLGTIRLPEKYVDEIEAKAGRRPAPPPDDED